MTDLEEAIRDPERLAALRRAGLLDTPVEEPFDRLTRLGRRVLQAPVCLISLVDTDRQFFKSCDGLPEPWSTRRETPLSHSFCQHVVLDREPVVIDNSREDPRVRGNLAARALGVGAYLGVPLRTADGHVLGSFCAIDTQPRDWTPEDISVLRDLAATAMTIVELQAGTSGG